MICLISTSWLARITFGDSSTQSHMGFINTITTFTVLQTLNICVTFKYSSRVCYQKFMKWEVFWIPDFEILAKTWDPGVNIKVFIYLCVLCHWSLNSGPTSWATPPVLFLKVFFQDRVFHTIFPSWLWTTILLILASWVGRMTGVSHWCLAKIHLCFLSTLPPNPDGNLI
jgi:hypothetical protein